MIRHLSALSGPRVKIENYEQSKIKLEVNITWSVLPTFVITNFNYFYIVNIGQHSIDSPA